MRNLIISLLTMIMLSLNTHAQIITDGLVAYWPFNGNTLDISGNNHHGVLSGPDLVNDRLMIQNMAYSFNKSNDDYIYTDIHDSLLTNYTAVGWFYWMGGHNSHGLGTFIDGGEGWAWKTYDGRIRFAHATVSVRSSFFLVPRTWFHVAISFDGSMARLYINGVEDISLPGPAGEGENFFIGAIPRYTSDFNWDGYIDEVSIYNRALTSEEILLLYKDGTYVIDTVWGIDTITVVETIQVYDTITIEVNDTINIPIYDTITVEESISVTDTLIIKVNFNGISDNGSSNILKVYPNPAKDLIYINTGDYPSMYDYTIKITNTLGTSIFENQCDQPEFQINLSAFGKTGLYYIQLLDGTGQHIDTHMILLE